jgi:hypothetical protein
VVGGATAVPYQAELTNVPPGLHTLVARATDNRGRTGISAGVQVRVNAPPVVTLVEPVNGAVLVGSATIRANLSDADGTVVLVEVLRNGEVALASAPQGPEFVAGFGFPGVQTFAVRVTDNLGVSTTSPTVQVTVQPFTVGIGSPAGGSTVNAGNVLVSGTFQGPADSSIRVNGILATLVFDGFGGTFSAVVALAVGDSEIVAELTSPSATIGVGAGVRVTVLP